MTGYSSTKVESYDEGYLRSYMLNADADGKVIIGDPETLKEKLPPELGDLIRIFIVGRQRASLSDLDANNGLELAFTKAKDALRTSGYDGLYVRFAPIEPIVYDDDSKTGVRLLPGGEGPVPTFFWQEEVESRMKYCRGVALLDGAETSLAVQWEIELAKRLRKAVHPLNYWLKRPRHQKKYSRL